MSRYTRRTRNLTSRECYSSIPHTTPYQEIRLKYWLDLQSIDYVYNYTHYVVHGWIQLFFGGGGKRNKNGAHLSEGLCYILSVKWYNFKATVSHLS